MMDFVTKIFSSIAETRAEDWDGLTDPEFPFYDHSFLRALEESGCVGAQAGWVPLYLTAWKAGRIAGAMPVYVKGNSYGEYIFDWEWARAYHAHGVAYFPKLVSAVPFTPATGAKCLIDPASASGPHAQAERTAVRAALLRAGLKLCEQMQTSSWHLLFLRDAEMADCEAQGFIPRVSLQYHWRNRGYESFERFLSSLQSRKRKQILHEREEVKRAGVETFLLTGEELSMEHARVMHSFYLSTIAKWGAIAYLSLSFFEEVFRTMSDRIVLVLARRDQRWIAGTLNYRKGGSLFGRYWGCLEEVQFLHFELCYYRLIEYAIAERIALFEAGAQGEHKMARGFLPERTLSAHYIVRPEFRRAIEDFVGRESALVESELEQLKAHSPFSGAI